MQAAKRVLGASKQRARPITLGEIRNVIATTAHWGALGTLVRLIALIAFWGGFRLGALLPHQGSQVNGDAMRLSDLDLLTNAVVVRSTKDKTNQFRERMHSLTLPMSRHDTQTCIKTRWSACWRSYHARRIGRHASPICAAQGHSHLSCLCKSCSVPFQQLRLQQCARATSLDIRFAVVLRMLRSQQDSPSRTS